MKKRGCPTLPSAITIRRTGTSINQSPRAWARVLGNDDIGNILGKILSEQGGKNNVFPQFPAINRGDYRIFEKEIRAYIQTTGRSIDIE
jgi:hypothetical protein